VTVKVRKLRDNVQLPQYAHGASEDAGMDLRCLEDEVLNPGQIQVISTGLKVEIPTGFMGEVRSRSGLACEGIVVNNSPGTIDPGYRGEVKVILHNQTVFPKLLKRGDRIAQLVVVAYEAVEWEEAELSSTVRGAGGQGSTGVI